MEDRELGARDTVNALDRWSVIEFLDEFGYPVVDSSQANAETLIQAMLDDEKIYDTVVYD